MPGNIDRCVSQRDKASKKGRGVYQKTSEDKCHRELRLRSRGGGCKETSNAMCHREMRLNSLVNLASKKGQPGTNCKRMFKGVIL